MNDYHLVMLVLQVAYSVVHAHALSELHILYADGAKTHIVVNLILMCKPTGSLCKQLAMTTCAG